jgi:WD40 repeat protein
MLIGDGVSVVLPGHGERGMFLAGVDSCLCAYLTVLVFACFDPLLFFSSLLISSILSVMSSDLVCFSQGVTCVVALPDGRRVISGSSDGSLRVWDVDTGECVQKLEGHRNVSEC